MNKHDKTQNNTSLIASNLMKNIIQTQQSFSLSYTQQLPYTHQHNNHSQLSNPFYMSSNNNNNHNKDNQLQIQNNPSEQQNHQFRINLQYHQPSNEQHNTSKLNKLKNHHKLKPIKNLQLLTQKQRNSKIIQHLKKNLFSLHLHQTKPTKINQTLFIKTQQQQKRNNKKLKQSQQFTENSNPSFNQPQNQNTKSLQKRNNNSERQQSPSKVSVNFQLYFPKQKLRTTINHLTRAQPRRSININGLQKQVFRIKKSSKSVSLHEQNQRLQFQMSENGDELKKERQILQEQVLVSLRENSAKKYIQKVQKFKKFKDNKITKQPLFGLNVTQAEYHEFKLNQEGKRIIQRNTPLENVTNNILPHQLQSQNKGEYDFKMERMEYHNKKNADLHLTVSEGQSLSFSYLAQNYMSELKPILSIQKSQLSPHQKKSPSQRKLQIKSSIIIASDSERKKHFFKAKLFSQNQNKTNDNLLKFKLIGMLNCLDVILNSFCCKIFSNSQNNKQETHKSNKNIIFSQNKDCQQLPLKQHSLIRTKQKFYYYVGSGNNKNLIRSIMKKRGWWAQTQKIYNANFVWTQLKVTDILQKQQKISQKIIEEPDSWHFKLRDTELSSQKIQKLKKQKIDSMQKFHKIFHKSMLPVYYKKLTQKQKQYEYLRCIKTPSIIHNHYDANYMIGNKKALFYNITQYCTYKKICSDSLIPLTFHIQSTKSKQFKSWIKLTKKSKNTIWIVKPGQNSNRGNGIFVEKDVNKIIQHIEKHADQKHSFIIQKYMKNIFLYNRRKFDIRVYMIMCTIGGITKFYWYEEGYIRTSSEIYNAQDITDRFIHLTNDAVQAKNDTYSKYEKGNKVSYTQFQRYLDITYPQHKYNVDNLVSKMKSIAQIAVRSTYAKLEKNKKVNGFELFGLDFLVDKHFSPWLLEVNTNPCLELSSPVLERLIPRMLQNMFRLTIDPIFRPEENISKHSSYFLYDNLLEKNKFQLIFDGLFDSDFEWQEICLKQKDVVYEDEDEVFENNGLQMDIMD